MKKDAVSGASMASFFNFMSLTDRSGKQRMLTDTTIAVSKPFDSSILASTRDSLGFITNTLQSPTECWFRGKADDLIIPRGNEGES
jgi:hypothetical protein